MIEVSGIDELKLILKGLEIDIDEAAMEGAEATAYQVRNTAIKSIKQVSQGKKRKIYLQGGTPHMHTSSKAGDAPNVDTGVLIKSIAVERGIGHWLVGSSDKKAPWLEFGTKSIAPRPFLYPALRENIGNLSENVLNAIKRRI